MPTTLRGGTRELFLRVARAFLSHDSCECVRRTASLRFATCAGISCIALSLRPACVCGTFRCISGPSSRATSAGCMLLGISGCLLSVSLRRRAILYVSLDADAYNVTLTAILLQFLRYRARSRPPSPSCITQQIHRVSRYHPARSRLQAAVPFTWLSFARGTAPSGLEGLASVWPCHCQAAADP